MTPEQLNLAKVHATLPNEGICHGADDKPWAYSPTVTLGAKPVASNFPAWWAGPVYPEYPRIIVWFTVFREAGSLIPSNSRVALKDLQLCVRSKATGLWTMIDSGIISGFHATEDTADGSKVDWTARTEVDGSLSVKPPKNYMAHGWGTMKTINVADLSGVYASITHRLVADDPAKMETRPADKWLVNVGVDYYSPEGVPQALCECLSGRYLRPVVEWRTSYGVAL